MRTAIVSTSIHARPAAYAKWAEQGDLIIAGDINTPVALINWLEDELGGMYITPGRQDFPGANHVPWKCVQRRNAAIWKALELGYESMILVDDDNTPVRNDFVRMLTLELGHRPENVLSSDSAFLNIGDLCLPSFRQRGNPYGIIGTKPFVQPAYPPSKLPEVVVAQAMVIGDPDCDAVERMVNHPEVSAVAARGVVQPGRYAAFNSQATAWRRDWAPVSAVLPHVGRYDDIFASFLFGRLGRTYNVALYAGDPVVKQNRNEHNLIKDLAAEVFGMSIVFSFCDALDNARITDSMPLWMAYSELISAVSHLLPKETVAFANAWVNGWKELK